MTPLDFLRPEYNFSWNVGMSCRSQVNSRITEDAGCPSLAMADAEQVSNNITGSFFKKMIAVLVIKRAHGTKF